MTTLKPGQIVEWSWGTGAEMGRVLECFVEPTSRLLDSHVVTMEASLDDPAYLVERLDGTKVWKSHSEVRAV